MICLIEAEFNWRFFVLRIIKRSDIENLVCHLDEVNTRIPFFHYLHFVMWNTGRPVLPDVTRFFLEGIDLVIESQVCFHNFITQIKNDFLLLFTFRPVDNLFEGFYYAMRNANNSRILFSFAKLFKQVCSVAFCNEVCPSSCFIAALELLHEFFI